MKVLIACEESQEVCKAFRALGHEAYSCDIQECSGGHPEWHIISDAIDTMISCTGITQSWDTVNLNQWDLVIAFPPCTDLAVSGARYFKQKRKDGRQAQSIDFFMQFTKLGCKWAIENPIGIMSTHYRKPDQIIQPWQFGHGETKSTCLWLSGLPKLQQTL